MVARACVAVEDSSRLRRDLRQNLAKRRRLVGKFVSLVSMRVASWLTAMRPWSKYRPGAPPGPMLSRVTYGAVTRGISAEATRRRPPSVNDKIWFPRVGDDVARGLTPVPLSRDEAIASGYASAALSGFAMADCGRSEISVEGVVYLYSTLGLFLDVAGRLVFIPANFVSPLPEELRRGEAVTLRLPGSYAERKGLVARRGTAKPELGFSTNRATLRLVPQPLARAAKPTESANHDGIHSVARPPATSSSDETIRSRGRSRSARPMRHRTSQNA
jgi:hypothetical protein